MILLLGNVDCNKNYMLCTSYYQVHSNDVPSSFFDIFTQVSMKSWTSLKLGHVRPKSRSLDQILEKLFLHSKGLKVLFQYLSIYSKRT